MKKFCRERGGEREESLFPGFQSARIWRKFMAKVGEIPGAADFVPLRVLEIGFGRGAGCWQEMIPVPVLLTYQSASGRK